MSDMLNIVYLERWKLTLNDGSDPAKTVARSHPPVSIGGWKGYLEIFPEGLHMVELIVVTWLFVEGTWNSY